MLPDPNRRPGDLIIDHYLPEADEETREVAREMLRAWAIFLIRLGERIEPERMPRSDSEESLRRPTI
jgi:hypothetical protein